MSAASVLSEDGFAFTNAWPSEPAVVLPTPFGKIDIGNASAGLCGGMVFAALDYWYGGVAVPTVRPAAGTPLYSFVVRRLVDSWNLPAGVAQYFHWMCLPDGDSGFDVFGRHVLTDRGIAWRTIKVQWPQIRADLDAGTPVALGIVTVASAHPKDLGQNHQVLACGYTLTRAAVTVQVYDPNQGQRDDIWIEFDPRNATRPTSSGTTSAWPSTRYAASSVRPTRRPRSQWGRSGRGPRRWSPRRGHRRPAGRPWRSWRAPLPSRGWT